jgi:glycosyltransferase involved in cell wall biosynthesis
MTQTTHSESLREPRAIRVVIVAPSLDILGGQSVQADRLMARLADVPGLEIGFLAVNPRLPGPLALLQRVKYVRTAITSVAYFVELLRRVPKYDVVHVFSASYWSYLIAPVPAMVAGKLFRRRVLLNYHSGHAANHFANWKTFVPFARLADSIVVPSDYLAEVFREFGFEVSVVFNFIDEDAYRFTARPTLAPRFLANRNLEPGYNVACVLRAFGRIQQRRPEASLTVAGTGSQESMLRSLAGTLGLRNVEWLGRVAPERMPELYARSDVYLNAPDVDNMPLSVLEAHMTGIPVVTTNAGGIPFIVDHGVTGWMVACDDDVALAEGALTLLEDPALAQSIARRAREVCETRYVWGAVGPQWMQAYLQLARPRVRATTASSATRDEMGAPPVEERPA